MKSNVELFIRDLGDGLVLRRASSADAETLADINSRMHSDDGPNQPNKGIGVWVRDLLTKPHPTLQPGDFTVVEESATGRIVSTLCLIPQVWTYDGIEFGAGRPELVCTLPEFRKRGLIRAQMDEVHKWSAERGHLLQFITGIPYFYRQFGYDMALNLSGRCSGFEPHVPVVKEGEAEPFRIRPAVEGDVEFILQTYERSERSHAVSCKRNTGIVRYEISGKSAGNINRFEKLIIEDTNGLRVGYFEHSGELWYGAATCTYFALVEGAPWLEVSPCVARYLWKKGGEFAERDSKTRTSFSFSLGESHPVYLALDDKLPIQPRPYAYYMRVPDLPAFLLRVKPALEQRLAESAAAGFTGELKINFYNNGLRMAFERGRISAIEPASIQFHSDADAAFPDLTFLHMVFGHRSFDELRHTFADCYWQNNTARVLLNALFPKKMSAVLAIT